MEHKTEYYEALLLQVRPMNVIPDESVACEAVLHPHNGLSVLIPGSTWRVVWAFSIAVSRIVNGTSE